MKYGSVANSDYSAMHFIANLTSHAFSFLEKKSGTSNLLWFLVASYCNIIGNLNFRGEVPKSRVKLIISICSPSILN